MKKLFLLIVVSLLFLWSCSNKEKPAKSPNIIYILADDLGYGETGAYGQEKILTPNIDKLAQNGMRFTQHYSGAPVCAPARCVLLTGKHTGHAYIRGNDEWGERGEVWNYLKAIKDPHLEGQRPIPANTITIAKLLKKAGYRTGIFGKWGLGAPGSEGVPTKQGFDYFYGYNCQRQAHNLYPPYLWENDHKDMLDNVVVPPGTKLDSGTDPYDEESYAKFRQKEYAPEKIHEKAIEFIKQNKDTTFFLYYASPLPHLPLQVPKEYEDRYRKIFGDEEPYVGDKGYFPTRYPHAVYAGMISCLDDQVGDIVMVLKNLGIYDNTILFFSSDNGPTYLGGVDFDFFNSSGPFQNGYGHTKGFVYEGGIRIPFIAAWPGHIEPGTESDHVSAFYDVLPTFCDITNIETPENTDGISFLPALLGKKQLEHEFLYWEFPSYKGQQAVRMGKWKGVRKNIFKGNMHIELYDLETDIREEHDVSAEHPEIVAQIKQIMISQHVPSANPKFKFPQLGDE